VRTCSCVNRASRLRLPLLAAAAASGGSACVCVCTGGHTPPEAIGTAPPPVLRARGGSAAAVAVAVWPPGGLAGDALCAEAAVGEPEAAWDVSVPPMAAPRPAGDDCAAVPR
jgi:hypothetical protein